MNPSGSNRSRSSIVSPLPMKTIPLLVSATAESAPPPFAVPSILVMMTPSMPIASWNRRACSLACWPSAASMTSQRWVAFVMALRSIISWMRSASSAWRPWVSTMMSSRSFKAARPSLTILRASFSFGSPKQGTLILCTERGELVVGTRAEGIGTDHPDLHAFLLEVAGKLCGGRGLAAALQARHEDGLGFELDIGRCPDEADQFLVHDPEDVLADIGALWRVPRRATGCGSPC